MHQTAVYTRVYGKMQKVTHKTARIRMVTLLEQHLANVNSIHRSVPLRTAARRHRPWRRILVRDCWTCVQQTTARLDVVSSVTRTYTTGLHIYTELR